MRYTTFGQKFKKLRKEKGLSQYELAKKLGYVTNSYIADMENGKFIPSEKKLKKLAKALGVSFKEMRDLLLETKIENLGIDDPVFISLFKEYPNLTKEEKRAIIEAYLKVKEKK